MYCTILVILDFEETVNLLGKEDNFKFAAVTKLLLK